MIAEQLNHKTKIVMTMTSAPSPTHLTSRIIYIYKFKELQLLPVERHDQPFEADSAEGVPMVPGRV